VGYRLAACYPPKSHGIKSGSENVGENYQATPGTCGME